MVPCRDDMVEAGRLGEEHEVLRDARLVEAGGGAFIGVECWPAFNLVRLRVPRRGWTAG